MSVLGAGNDGQRISLILASGELVARRETALITKFERIELALFRLPGVHRTQKHIPGLFWVSQINELVWYESRLEMFILKQLDFTQKIKAILPQPFCLHYQADGKRRHHIPDFLVWLDGGRRLLVNVKPRRHVEKPQNQRSFKACTELCESLGWDYLTLSEPNPIFLANLNWLAGYRRVPAKFDEYASKIVEMASTRQTVHELLDCFGPKSVVRPILFYLMWKRFLEFDTRAVLSSTSEVWLSA